MYSAKKSFFLLSNLLACSLMAEEPYDCTTENYCKLCYSTLECPPEVCAYNAPATLNPCGCFNLYVTGSFIYWRASGDYLTYGLLNNFSSPIQEGIENLLFRGKVLEPDFKYKPGYKVGLGYKFDRDDWDVYAEYTSFHQKVHTSKEVDIVAGQRIHATWITFVTPAIIGDAFRSCSSSWTTDFDILDAEVGREFFWGRCLTFRPSLGLRTLWLKQNYNLTYLSLIEAIPVYSFNKSSSWGIGPRLGLNTNWNLCGGLKIVGDFGFSLLHVQDHVSVKQSTPFLLLFELSDDVTYSNKESISLVKSIFDCSLGLGWGSSFCSDKLAFNLQVSYDYALYSDQGSIQLGHAPLVPPGGVIQVLVGNTALSTGNLSIQGLTVTVRLDF